MSDLSILTPSSRRDATPRSRASRRRIGRRLGALLTAALLLLPGVGCATRVPAPAVEPLRVLVYNIHAGRDAVGVDNLARVAAMIRETAADLVLLQEVDRRTERSGRVDQLAELERATGFHGRLGKTLDYQGGEYGIAILSRWPVEHDTLVSLPVSPPQARAGGSYEPRGAQRATIRAPRATLEVINTHIDPSGTDHYRRQEVATILALVRELRADTSGRGPLRRVLLVGGDLNSTPESAVQRLIRDAGLRDAWMECGTGDGGTFPAAHPVKRIDYLYLLPGPRCVEARVLDSQASDHRALLVTLVP